MVERLTAIARAQGRLAVSGAPEGYDAYVAAEAAMRLERALCCSSRPTTRAPPRRWNARGSSRPTCRSLHFPAWDCLPYDRVSPRPTSRAQRLATLAALAARGENERGRACRHHRQRAPAARAAARDPSPRRASSPAPATEVDLEALTRFLARNGYSRTGTVREPGEFALRGGIVDLWPPGAEEPLRLDFFGSQLEAIRRFDAEIAALSGTQ